MSQQKQNEPSKAAMEAARNLFTDFGLAGRGKSTQFSATCAYYAAHIDAAMQHEREAAEKMAEFIRKRTKHEVHMNADCPCSSCEGQRLVAAYEAARGK